MAFVVCFTPFSLIALLKLVKREDYSVFIIFYKKVWIGLIPLHILFTHFPWGFTRRGPCLNDGVWQNGFTLRNLISNKFYDLRGAKLYSNLSSNETDKGNIWSYGINFKNRIIYCPKCFRFNIVIYFICQCKYVSNKKYIQGLGSWLFMYCLLKHCINSTISPPSTSPYILDPRPLQKFFKKNPLNFLAKTAVVLALIRQTKVISQMTGIMILNVRHIEHQKCPRNKYCSFSL